MEKSDGGKTVLDFFLLSLVFTTKSIKCNNTPIHNASQVHFNLVWKAFILGFSYNKLHSTLHVDTILRSVVCFNKHLLLYITTISNHLKCRRSRPEDFFFYEPEGQYSNSVNIFFTLNYKRSQPIRISNDKSILIRV